MPDEKVLNRRDFLIKAGLAGAGIYLAGCAKKPGEALPTPFSEVNPAAPEATITPETSTCKYPASGQRCGLSGCGTRR